MKLTLLGAARGVTGSKLYLEHAGLGILLDCGMYQGSDELEKLNLEPVLPPDKIRTLHAIILSHGHLDHCGLVPKLIKDGFNGPIYASAETAELATLLWHDTLNIEEDLIRHQRTYEFEHVQRAKKLLTVVKPLHDTRLIEGMTFCFYPNGHILGSQSISISHMGVRKLLFSSDLGRPHRYLPFNRATPPGAPTVVLESTYGDRKHHAAPALQQLHELINKHAGKKILMATFAIDRLQELLLLLLDYKQHHSLDYDVYIDSPMGLKSTEIYLKSEHLQGTVRHKLEQARRQFHWIEHASQRKAFLAKTGPTIMLASSGMLEGGRVRSYLQHYLPEENTLLILTGFQAQDTLGARLKHGEKQVEINKQHYPVAMKIEVLQGLSAHADQGGLIDWVAKLPEVPKHIVLNHGEESAQAGLMPLLRHQFPQAEIKSSYDQQEFDL